MKDREQGRFDFSTFSKPLGEATVVSLPFLLTACNWKDCAGGGLFITGLFGTFLGTRRILAWLEGMPERKMVKKMKEQSEIDLQRAVANYKHWHPS